MEISDAFLYPPIEEELFIEHPKNRGMIALSEEHYTV